jgi:hypothetical protein
MRAITIAPQQAVENEIIYLVAQARNGNILFVVLALTALLDALGLLVRVWTDADGGVRMPAAEEECRAKKRAEILNRL